MAASAEPEAGDAPPLNGTLPPAADVSGIDSNSDGDSKLVLHVSAPADNLDDLLKPENTQLQNSSIDLVEEEEEVLKESRNPWAAKKTVAQGMMDVALITSNANQLRYLVMYGRGSYTFVISVTLICISLLLQIAVGMALIFKGRSDLKGDEKKEHANKLNNYVVVGVFLVTIINVFAASFSDVDGRSPAAAAPTPPPVAT